MPKSPGSNSSGPIIEAVDLTKTYRAGKTTVHALDGLSLSVPQGRVRALLGPNGAGKTTAAKVLTTLLKPDSGTAHINGIDVLKRPEDVKRIIGASGQYAAVDENLTGYENLQMVGQLYHLGRPRAKARARELIDLFGLSEAKDRPVKGFSGGMRRRIDLACALVINPRILFLDEPTTGLDPRSRLALWEIIGELVASGATLLLTTQYLEEADRLADDISVIDDGKVIAEGTSDELKAQIGGHHVEVSLVDPTQSGIAARILTANGDSEARVHDQGRRLDVPVSSGPAALQAVLTHLGDAEVRLHDAGMRRPTLDDVFLTLTGKSAEEDPEEDEDGDGDATGREDEFNEASLRDLQATPSHDKEAIR